MSADNFVHNDLPTTEDLVEWQPEVDNFIARIRSCRLPHVLGIHGDWGSGKTSFMRQVQRGLGCELPADASVDANSSALPTNERRALQKQYVTVWFDAWRYQNEPVPIVALLQEMKRQLSLVPTVIAQLKKLGSVTAYGIFEGLADMGKVLGVEGLPSVEKIEKRGEQWEKDNFETKLTSASIREHLCKTIRALLPSENARIVVFIDDLDRCNSHSAMRLLEGLKIYLSIPSCVFVLGMNERILVDVLRAEVTTPSSNNPNELTLRASHYLEKICSDIYRLPAPASGLALLSKWISNREQKHALTLAIGGISCLPPNPRRLKSLANQWQRFSARVPFPDSHEQQKLWCVKLLIVIYIYQSHRDIWERLSFNSDFWEEVLLWCQGLWHSTSIENRPTWTHSLRMMYAPDGYDEVTSQAIFKSTFPNPGDIENFWIGELVIKYRDQLTSADLKPFLRNFEAVQ